MRATLKPMNVNITGLEAGEKRTFKVEYDPAKTDPEKMCAALTAANEKATVKG